LFSRRYATRGLQRFAERLANRSRLEHREIFGHALHRRLDRARAARAAFDDVALLYELVVAAVGEQADDAEDNHCHQHFEQCEAARAHDHSSSGM
jgi:hypothetical protein